MRKAIIRVLIFIADALRALRIPRGTLLWRIRGVLLWKIIHGFLLHNLKRDTAIIHGYKMFLDKQDSLGLSLAEFEPGTVRIFKEYIKPGTIVLDIGANIGYYTLLAAKLGADVYAIEAEPNNFKLLKKNVEYNGHNVTLVNKAAFDKNETVKLYVNPNDNGAHSLDDKHSAWKIIEVEAVILDEYLPSNFKPDFIKIDIEGMEYYAMLGMKNMLNKPNIKMVIEYCTGTQNKTRLLDLLKSYGFKFYEIIPRGLVPFLPEAHEKFCANLFCVKD